MYRGVSISNPLCPLCNKGNQTNAHLLITCEYTREVIDWVFKWCGIQNKSFATIKDFIDYAVAWGNCPRNKSILNMVFCCFIWNIWMTRNDEVFKKIGVPPTKIVDNIISLSYI